MPAYKAPLRDINFVMNELLEAEAFYQTLPGFEEATQDLMDAIVEEGAKFAENVLSPLNQSGDEEGCTWSEDGVKTPAGFADAYRQYVENGWPAVGGSPEYDGMGLPSTVAFATAEMLQSPQKMRVLGLEPKTYGLKGRCSTN